MYCYEHKKENMIDVKSKKNCKKQPVFNYEGNNTGIYCFKHKKGLMLLVKNVLNVI